MGWDLVGVEIKKHVVHFNPPTPHGVGPSGISPASSASIFQSTHPAWGGTTGLSLGSVFFCISIHPPRMGWDQILRRCQQTLPDFNPPTPHGVGPSLVTGRSKTKRFQSTHPAWGGTGRDYPLCGDRYRFQSTHPVWGGTTSPERSTP